MKRIAVFGAGAIGGTIAAYLARGGRTVTLIDAWEDQIRHIAAHGLTVRADGETFTVPMTACHIEEVGELPDPIDVLVIATKAYDTVRAYEIARGQLADGSVIISAQNGIVEEKLRDMASTAGVVGCAVLFAGESTQLGEVVRRSPMTWPSLAIGELDGTVSDRIRALHDALSPLGKIEVTDNIMGKLWAKLAVNAMSNGTCAVTLATSGQVWGDDEFAPISVALASETAYVASECGVHMEPVFGHVAQQLLVEAYRGDAEAIDEAARSFRKVAQIRASERDNKPSMLQDVLKGRKTEIDDINGYIVQRGASVGVATPANARLIELVHEVERGIREPGPHNIAELARTVRDAV